MEYHQHLGSEASSDGPWVFLGLGIPQKTFISLGFQTPCQGYLDPKKSTQTTFSADILKTRVYLFSCVFFSLR